MPRKREVLQPSPEKTTEFSIPREGLFEDLEVEVLTDRSRFVGEVLGHMKLENPLLRSFLVGGVMINLHRDVALEYALIYYELHARPGRMDASQPRVVQVEQSTFDEVNEDRARVEPLIGEMKALDPDSDAYGERRVLLRTILHAFDEKKERRKREDANRSQEFGNFWGSVAMFTLKLLREDERGADIIDNIFEPVNFVAEFLYRQRMNNIADRKPRRRKP